MGLSDLFRKSEWKNLQKFPAGVQHDIASLISLDSLVKTAVANGISLGQEPFGRAKTDLRARLCQRLGEPETAHEIQLAVLSTGVGKEFASIRWNFLPAFRGVSILGILAMCEYRNAEQLIVENDIKHSGYSADPDEARTQLLVLLARKERIEDLDQLRVFDHEVFRDFWLDLRKTIFVDLQLNVQSEPPGLSLTVKERFERLSSPRKQILLLLADSLFKKVQKAEPAPFNLKQNQREHPFKYVPYTKLIYVMHGLAPRVEHFVSQLPIDDYELRRIVGASRDAPKLLLAELLTLDADTAAYCMVVASVMKDEPDFASCGVWKKLTEAFERKNMKLFGVAAQARVTGMIGDTLGDAEAVDFSKSASLALNMVQDIRHSARNYLKSTGDGNSRISVLLAGTMVLKHVLNHPRFGKTLAKFIIESFASLEPVLGEIKFGELITWAEQEKLTI